MHYLPTFVVLGAAAVSAVMETGQHQSLMALKGVMERQLQLCKPVPAPATCEKSCGPGYITCISFPTCYNPGNGESCCSNGKYCDAGFYCTDAGCCPNGTPLSQCGATVSLSVIPPPAASPTDVPPPVTTSPPPTTETSAAPTSYPPAPPPAVTSSYPSKNSTTSSSPTTVVTAGAAQLGSNVLAGLGGVGAFLMAL